MVVNTVLYGEAMNERFSAADWIKAGYAALSAEGFGALKADVLAKKLDVSRGSFYWHFADVGAFHRAVIAHWRQTTTEAVIAGLKRRGDAGRLGWLLRNALSNDSRMELAMRAWAAQDATAAEAVATVDQRRLGYIVTLLREQGVAAKRARTLAAIYYWTYLGNALSRRKPSRALLDAVVAEFAALTGGGP